MLLPTTFEPEQYGDFTLSVSSEDDVAFTLSAVADAPSGGGYKGAAPPRARPAPPAPPSGRLKPESDPTLSAVLARLKHEAAGPFDDPEFRVHVADAKGKASAINGKLLYLAGHPSSSDVKVDSFHRLSEMGGKGPLTSAGGAASLMCHRRALSDLWLLGAIGMVSTRQSLLESLIAYHDESLGLAAVRLFKDGAWRTVVVDDQVPCHGKLKLAHSSNAEPRDGPVSLVSKALAKLYGCYEHLKVGRVGSALEDLTGGYHDKIYLRDGVKGKGPGGSGRQRSSSRRWTSPRRSSRACCGSGSSRCATATTSSVRRTSSSTPRSAARPRSTTRPACGRARTWSTRSSSCARCRRRRAAAASSSCATRGSSSATASRPRTGTARGARTCPAAPSGTTCPASPRSSAASRARRSAPSG